MISQQKDNTNGECSILVIVEYSLIGLERRFFGSITKDLILILMEHSLIVRKPKDPAVHACLNPYSNGTLSDNGLTPSNEFEKAS